MKKTITRTSTRVLSVLLVLLLLASSVPFAFADNCQHTNMHFVQEHQSDLCGKPGNIAYWVCNDCGNCFTTQAATQSLTYAQIYTLAPPAASHQPLGNIGFTESSTQTWLSVNVFDDLWAYRDTGMTYLELLAQGCSVGAFECANCGIVITINHGNWTEEMHPDERFYVRKPGETCAHDEGRSALNLGIKDESDVLCGHTEIKEVWGCMKCGCAFTDETFSQPLTSNLYSQYILIAPHDSHNITIDHLGFTDPGNGDPWLSTTAYNEKMTQDAYGMSFADKFANDGFTAKYCEHCGVVIQGPLTEQRARTLGCFVNPIPELAGAVRIPLSPKNLSAGEKWVDFASSVILAAAMGTIGEDIIESILFQYSKSDFYFNETTQKLFVLSSYGTIDEINGMTIRSVGDEENTTALPSSPEGLAVGAKWFDAAAIMQDVLAQYTPASEQERLYFELYMSYLAAAAFTLSADGSTVYARGRNAEIAALLSDPSMAQYADILNDGYWQIELNALAQDAAEDNVTIQISDYIKTVGGECVHVWSDGFETTAPTCTAAGIKTFTCTNACGETREEIIPALGHDWDGGFVTQQPTITETGICTYTCTRCTDTKTSTIAKLDPAPLLNELDHKNNLQDTADNAAVFFDDTANLPADTVFNYEVLEQTAVYQIFNLDLTSGGHSVEPETPVWVKLPIPKGWNPKWITVWHGAEKLPSFVDGDYIYFYTSHFSEFEVKCEEESQDDNSAQDAGTEPQTDANACKLCGEVHKGFPGVLIGFFHRIIYFFKHLFG